MGLAPHLQKQTVAEILTRWPKTVRIFIQRGLGCVGCVMAVFDTLEDVAHAYHLSLEDLVTEIEAAIGAGQCATDKNTK